MAIKTVYICTGTTILLEKEEQLNIIRTAVAKCQQHDNTLNSIFKYARDSNAVHETFSGVFPFTNNEDLQKETRELFNRNKPGFDLKKDVNFSMQFDFMKNGNTYTAAVFFVFVPQV